ncbi:TSUP family transporter [Knoellia koreensis]
MVIAAVAMADRPGRLSTEDGTREDRERFAVAGTGPSPAGSTTKTRSTSLRTLPTPPATAHEDRQPSWAVTVVAGLAVGILTGFFGVGGGFVIATALVIILGLPMQHEDGASLLIVVANSASSLLARTGRSTSTGR